MFENAEKQPPFLPWFGRIVVLHLVFCGLAWLYLEVVPYSIGLTLKLVILFALGAIGLCGFFWYRDKRRRQRRMARASQPDPSVK